MARRETVRVLAAYIFAETARLIVTSFAYTRLFDEADSLLYYERVSIPIGLAAFVLVAVIMTVTTGSRSYNAAAAITAFSAEYLAATAGYAVSEAGKAQGFPSGFILLVIAGVSIAVHIIPFAVSNITFFAIYMLYGRAVKQGDSLHQNPPDRNTTTK